MIITPTSLTITQLLSSTNEQYVVPPYQRRYSWHEKQLWELVDDLTLLEDADTHLLGSIVCLTGHHMAGINKLELVDGQQRLTTISILLQCILDRLKRDATSRTLCLARRGARFSRRPGFYLSKPMTTAFGRRPLDDCSLLGGPRARRQACDPGMVRVGL